MIKVEDKRKQLLRAMSPLKKIELFMQLRELAWNIKKAGIQMQHSDWNDKQTEDEVKRIFRYARS